MRESNRIQRFARLGALRLLLRRRVEVVCLCILLRGRQMKSRVGKEEERDKRNFRLGNKAGRASISTILKLSINCHWQVNSYLIDCWVPSLVTNIKSLASSLHAYSCHRRKGAMLIFTYRRNVAIHGKTSWQESQTWNWHHWHVWTVNAACWRNSSFSLCKQGGISKQIIDLKEPSA